jgi:hypothetical protein
MSEPLITPWMDLDEAGKYACSHGRRFLRREMAGRLRAARIGGRKEYFTRREWIDAWLEDRAKLVMVSRREFGR